MARMDSDDICVPNRFQRQIGFLENNRTVDVVGGAIAEFDHDFSAPCSIRHLPAGGQVLRRFAKSRTPMNHMTVVFRKASVVNAGSYESCEGFEDYHLWARMLTRGYSLLNLKDVLVYARCGNGMQERRGGFVYLKRDIRFQLFLHKLGLVSASECFGNILVRSSVRLAPRAVRSLCYRLFLRSGVPHETKPIMLNALMSPAKARSTQGLTLARAASRFVCHDLRRFSLTNTKCFVYCGQHDDEVLHILAPSDGI